MRPSSAWCVPVLGVLMLLLLTGLNLFQGSVRIPAADVLSILSGRGSDHPAWQFIILSSRLPQTLTAILGGAALAVSGLMLQTAFENPLAGPSVFGVTSGASLGVALVMLLSGGSLSLGVLSAGGCAAVLLAALLGALSVTALLLFFSSLVRDNVMLLIIGIMTGYLASSVVTLLNFSATEEDVRSYMVWGMGHFGGVSPEQMPVFATVILSGLAASLLLVKPLNAFLLGDRYAENLGVNVVRFRHVLLLITGVLTAVVTAYCGPVAFIGLAVPHLARLVLRTDDHRRLLPMTMLSGALVALLCNWICFLPADGGMLPLNAVTPLIGAPVIIYIILKKY